MSHFRNDIVAHKLAVGKYMVKASSILSMKAVEHDINKIKDDEIFDVYEKYSETYRGSKYGSAQRKRFEKKMSVGIDKHLTDERHHFYDSRCKVVDINLFDMVEMISDWLGASERDCNTKQKQMERVTLNINEYFNNDEVKKLLMNTALELLNGGE